MPGGAGSGGGGGGGGQFGFGDWSHRDFHDRFTAIIGGGRRNNTYKFAMARFLLDLSCDPCMMVRVYGRAGDGAAAGGAVDTVGGIKVTYAEIARYFFAYYWPLACRARLRQGPARQRPQVMGAIEGEFGGKEYRQSACQMAREEPERVGRCLRKIAKAMPRQVVHRFQKACGGEVRMFYQYAAGPADREGNRRVDLGGGILVSRNAARFFRENYESLGRAVSLEWLRATDSFNPGAPDLAGRFLAAYGECEGACRFLPGLEAAGRVCFYCGARPGRDERMCIDHFLPEDHVGGAKEWNLVLACQGCSREKECMLPPAGHVGRLASRNAKRRGEGAPPAALLGKMTGLERRMERHYEAAKRSGYPVAESLPAAR